MKKTTLLLAILTCATVSFAQVNTLPTSGKVGIGTTNPNEALEVKGNMAVDSSMVIKDTLIVEDDARIMHDMRVDGATEVHDLVINGTTWMKSLQELNDNNFDILVTKEDGTVMRTGPGSLFPAPQDPLGLCDIQGGYSDNPYWISEPNKLYALCSETRVGIRTNQPTKALDVRGSGFFSTGISVGNPSFVPANSAFFEGYGSLGSLRPWIRFTVEENGDEETAFLVNNDGGIYCTSVRVRLRSDIPIPDYVFSDDYELMPLAEVKEFVDSESHLPNIPSEAEMREKGMSVEEMQLKLLEKIEELTLYVIEQNDRSDQLSHQNEKLRLKIQELEAKIYNLTTEK